MLLMVSLGGADCQTSMDCSLAGACSEATKTCACDSEYTGRFCERLREGKTRLIWPVKTLLQRIP